MWNPVSLKMVGMFSETSVLTKATRYNTPEDICHNQNAFTFYNYQSHQMSGVPFLLHKQNPTDTQDRTIKQTNMGNEP
jgi:hypothetical protein